MARRVPVPVATPTTLADEQTATGLRVLIVEDDMKLANMASMLLARDHHRVAMVSSAEAALEHLKELL